MVFNQKTKFNFDKEFGSQEVYQFIYQGLADQSLMFASHK